MSSISLLKPSGIYLKKRQANREIAKRYRRDAKAKSAFISSTRTNSLYSFSNLTSMETLLSRLTEQWMNETRNLSSFRLITENENYKSIIDIGMPAVSWILKDLSRSPKQWFVALHTITGADPIPEQDAGDFELMIAAWIGWGRANGFV